MDGRVVCAISYLVGNDFVEQLGEEEVECAVLIGKEVTVTRPRSWWSNYRGQFG